MAVTDKISNGIDNMSSFWSNYKSERDCHKLKDEPYKKLLEIPILKEDYEQQWTMASDSAREKAALYVVPGGYQYL